MPRKTIRIGAKGNDVKFLQDILAQGGYYGGILDGIFGPVTLAAVKAFQLRNGLNPDGICGRLTWELIESGWEDIEPEREMIGYSTDPRWLEIARGQIGISEVPGNQNNPQIVTYHQTTSLRADDDETPWCSSFVNWCLEQAKRTGTGSAAADSWLTWGTKLQCPDLGAITVLSRPGGNHVGFYLGETGDKVKILGGNQSNQVSVAYFSKSTVRGYRWPR